MKGVSMDLLYESVSFAARRVRDLLGVNSDLWLAFCRMAQLQRYDLNKVLEGERQANPATLIRISAVLEQVGVETRLRSLDPATKRVLMDYGLTKRGELKEYFPNSWDRTSLQKHLCLDDAHSVPMLGRIHDMARQLDRGQRISKKSKIEVKLVGSIKHVLKKDVLQAPLAVMADKPHVAVSGEGQRSAAESGVVTLNALATLFSSAIVPQQVSDRTQQDAVLAVTRILSAFGVSRERLLETKA